MTQQPQAAAQGRGPLIRDLIMGGILIIWMMYAVASVFQVFSEGAKVLDSLPPFWFWGIPIAPYTALYQPWTRGNTPPGPPEPPVVPEAPGAPA